MHGACNMAEGTLEQQFRVCSGSCRHLQHVCADHAVSHLCSILERVSLAGYSSFKIHISRCSQGDGELSRNTETARGGIKFVSLLLTWVSRLLLLFSLAMFFRAVLPSDTMEKAIKPTQNRSRLFRLAASPYKLTKAPLSAALAAMSHFKAAVTSATEANASPVSSAAKAPAGMIKTAASPTAAAEVGDITAVCVSPDPAESDVLVVSGAPDPLMSLAAKTVNDLVAQEHKLHFEDTKEHNGEAAAGEDESAMTARVEEAERHLRPASASAPFKAIFEQVVDNLKQLCCALFITESTAEKAETTLECLNQKARDAGQQIRQPKGRAGETQNALKELYRKGRRSCKDQGEDMA